MKKKEKKKETKKNTRPNKHDRQNGARGSDNRPIRTCKSEMDVRTRARVRPPGLNLVSDCSRRFWSSETVHKSHVSPIRVGPHFHLHLYSTTGRSAELNPPRSRGPFRSSSRAGSMYQAPNSETRAYCCESRARALEFADGN